MRWLLVLFIAAALGVQSARADGLIVSPTTLELPAKRPLSSFTLENDRDRETSIEISAFDWKQDANGGDILTPANDIVVTPSVFLVSARTAQTVRIGYTGPKREDREKSYRILVRELPNPQRQLSGGLNLLIEMSMPVFVTSGGRGALSVCKVDTQAIELSNTGASHIKLGATPGAQSSLPRYLLPGATIKTPLQSDGFFRAVTLTKGDREPQLSTLRMDDAPCGAPRR
jgi:fimbrial chaperone protein